MSVEYASGTSHVLYDNFYLSNEIEDQYNSYLDLQTFCQVDNTLVGVPGDTLKVNVYSATNGTETLEMGEGNTQSIEVSFTQKEYKIQLAQSRFRYYDEQAMKDPMLLTTGTRHMSVDMFNHVNGKIFAEFNKAKMVVVASAFGFACFADAQAMLNFEQTDGIGGFAFVCPADVAAIREALKDSLQYVEQFARTGYVGTVAGVNLYAKKDAVQGTVIMATRQAVTVFNKRGVTVERTTENTRSADDANIRLNTMFARKYFSAALTDETKDVKIVIGTAALSADTSVNATKTYYEKSGMGYVAVVPAVGDNPASKGWYEITATNF